MRLEARDGWRAFWSRRHSPRLCGWLREVSLRATSPAAAAQNLEAEEAEEVECRLGRQLWWMGVKMACFC